MSPIGAADAGAVRRPTETAAAASERSFNIRTLLARIRHEG
jgi:hypothetical protein